MEVLRESTATVTTASASTDMEAKVKKKEKSKFVAPLEPIILTYCYLPNIGYGHCHR